MPVWRRFFTKNSELASRVHAGKIRALPGIAKADGRTITFTDGQVRRFKRSMCLTPTTSLLRLPYAMAWHVALDTTHHQRLTSHETR